MNKEMQRAKDEAARELRFRDYNHIRTLASNAKITIKTVEAVFDRAMEIYAERVNGFQKVKAEKDDSGHWYVIPNELADSFYSDLENDDFCDSGEFDNKWGMYRTGGHLNLIQLYANNKTTKP